MADPISSGSDVSAGTYKCTNCGKELTTQSAESLPPCANCQGTSFEAISGGDSSEDPYPGKN